MIPVSEFEKLSYAEQDAAFEAGIVRDLNEVPPSFLAQVLTRLEERIAERDQTSSKSQVVY
jgi:hypothetical protein